MRRETEKFVKTAEGCYLAVLGLSYIENHNNNQYAKSIGLAGFDSNLYTNEQADVYWENYTNFCITSGKLIAGLDTKEKREFFRIAEARAERHTLKSGYSISGNVAENAYTFPTDPNEFTEVESDVVSLASIIGMGFEANQKVEDSFYNQEHVHANTAKEVLSTNAILNDEGGSYIESLARHVAQENKDDLSCVLSIMHQAHEFDSCQ